MKYLSVFTISLTKEELLLIHFPDAKTEVWKSKHLLEVSQSPDFKLSSICLC